MLTFTVLELSIPYVPLYIAGNRHQNAIVLATQNGYLHHIHKSYDVMVA